MKKIGQRIDEETGITHIVEMTNNEFASLYQLNEVCTNKYYDWMQDMGCYPPHSFTADFENMFSAIRRFVEAQLQYNELSCMVDRFADVLWGTKDDETE